MSLLLALFGLLIGLVGLLLGGLAVVVSNGDLLNGLLLGGLPAMVCGPIAYFLGRSAIGRIKESPTTLGGHPTAVAGWVIGAVGTALGALSTLTWLVLLLIANFGPPPA